MPDFFQRRSGAAGYCFSGFELSFRDQQFSTSTVNLCSAGAIHEADSQVSRLIEMFVGFFETAQVRKHDGDVVLNARAKDVILS